MTLAEKISQLYNESPAIEHLGVPQYDWWNEGLHGLARAGKATVFPQAIGMAATFNPALLKEIATTISDETRAKHHYFASNNVVFRYTGLTLWSPNINIFRDPRWGRGQETYGEDPFLTGTLAVQFIAGLQGDNPTYLKTAAMAKHFAVHSGPEKTRHSDDYYPTPKDLNETYLPAFEMAVKDANVEAVMCAYNRVNGAPACGNDDLLKHTLRDKWGFKGHVVSDCGALADFYDPLAHNVVSAPAAAAAWALKSGTDLNCGTGRMSTFANLHFALQRKMVREADIDQAVKRLLTTRFKLGVFDPPEKVPYSRIPMDVIGSASHLKLALTAAEESMVLLKNDGVLPLRANAKIAVIGPNANNLAVLEGNYHGDPISPVTPLQGIINRVGVERTRYAPGSALVAQYFGHHSVVPPEHFSHRDKNGVQRPGLVAEYHEANTEGGLRMPAKLTRIDPNIDFYWARSPLDNSVWDEFGVQWKGLLNVAQTGTYQFSLENGLSVMIDGKTVEDPIELRSGKTYTFSAETRFSRSWWGNNPLEPRAQLRWANISEKLEFDALHAAKASEVVVFISGISPDIEGEEMPVELPGFDHGDRSSITLPVAQLKLLKKLKSLKKPIVLVNMSGSAMALTWENKHLNAIIQGFYPGEATGTALANILWGDVNPSAKLPITFYKDLNDMPAFNDYSMFNRTYKFYRGKPLFPFGFGLSYSQFRYADASVTLTPSGTIRVTYNLLNNSAITGAEVSQLYMDLPDAPQHSAQRELVGFRKDTLKPGETQNLTIEIHPRQLSFVDINGVKQPYKGTVRFSLGGGQPGFQGSSNILEWEWQSPSD